LKKVLEKKKIKFEIAKGEGAFYGPKIDFCIKDSLEREWQLATIQLDFSMPERFDLTYIAEDNKERRPVMIHRAILGSLERFIGILIEHTNGNLPFWLSPIQCRIISVSQKYNEEAIDMAQDFNIHNELRTDVDDRNLHVSKKILEAEKERVPYIIVLGEKELKQQILTVRIRETNEIKEMKPSEFRESIKKKQNDMPFRPLPVHMQLSKRLRFT